jgi:enoyl-CoA hydratase/carnithine racemase
VSRLGLSAAKRLFLLAPTLDADELLRIGYLDAAVPPPALDEHIDALTAQLLAGAPLAIAGMKQSLDEIARGEFDVGRVREREAACAASADLREGLLAFSERRPPRFSGH